MTVEHRSPPRELERPVKVNLKVARNRKKRILVYMRCRSCGWIFEGNAGKAFAKWSKHVASCMKKHKES